MSATTVRHGPTTPRGPLLVRPWTEADAPALREAIDEGLAHLKPWLSWTLEEPAGLAQTRRRLRGWIREFRLGQGFRYAISPRRAPQTILGGVNLGCRFGPDEHDLGYWVRKSAARRGIASAAASRLIVHAFEVRSVNRLILQIDVGNRRSMSFARAMGFRFAEKATTAYPEGTPRPVLRFELSRARYCGDLKLLHRERARRVHFEVDELGG